MAKFYGKIGYASLVEISAGVWQEKITTRNYSGEIQRSSSKMREGITLNDDLTLDNRLSIVADPYAYEHYYKIRYIEWNSAKWKVLSVEIQRPRLLLSIGGVYNDQTT